MLHPKQQELLQTQVCLKIASWTWPNVSVHGFTLYAFMNILPESCEVLKVGENKQLHKILEEYLKCCNNMGKSNVSTTCRLFTRTLSRPNFF